MLYALCYVALIIMIKSMKVKVTYTLEMGDYTASETVKNRLIEACEKQELLDPNKIQDAETGDWIFDNVNERDALDWEFEIEEIT